MEEKELFETHKILLEKQESLKVVAFAYIQRVLNSPFFPIVLAADSSNIYIYNDDVADDIKNDRYVFNIKETLRPSEFKYIVHETFKIDREYKNYGRLGFIYLDEEKENIDIFYRKMDKKEMKYFLRYIKKIGFKIKRKKTKRYRYFI